MREVVYGGLSCGWGPIGASAAEVDPLQAQSIVEDFVDCMMRRRIGRLLRQGVVP